MEGTIGTVGMYMDVEWHI